MPNGQVRVKVLPPFQTQGMSLDSVNELTKHLQDKMQKEFDLLNKQVNLDSKYYTQKEAKHLGYGEITTNEENESKIQDFTSQSIFSDQTSLSPNDSNNNSINDEETKKQN